ncbi:MAG: NAD-dependent epimerase/dehydratase family protein [Myxococcales bacterium]|nr:NAD-dependent epimerase/dehydratase family protein [Myxococcales bacterium]
MSPAPKTPCDDAARTLLVTGGAGFIGSRFVTRHLAQHPDDRIIVLDALTYASRMDALPPEAQASGRLEFVHGSVRSPVLVEALVSRADAVVHFAAETHVPRSISDNLIFFETDVLGTQTLTTQIVRHAGRIERFVHVSSSEVYGSAHVDPMDEAHPLDPTTPYAAAKCGADRLVSAFAHTYELPAVILRPFNNYGPGQHLEKLIPRFITHGLADEPLTVHGRGEAARDWIYVDDTCDAIERVLAAPIRDVRGEVFNVGTGVATDVLTIARRTLELTGRGPELIEHTTDRPGQVSLHRADPKKLEERVGYRTTTALEDGLARTVAWYRDHPERWRHQLWMRSVPVADSDGTITWW